MNIIVTGGSRGIGYEIVKQFAVNANNHIVVFSRDFEKLKQLRQECSDDFNSTISIYKVDFNKPNLESEIRDIIIKENKHFHILINNAGLLINKPFTKTTNADWQTIFTVNIFAPVVLIKEVLAINNDREPTHIVNISSMGGFQGSVKFKGLSAYSSSKSALANLTEVLAEEYKDTNVKINCLALGSAQTEMLTEAFPDYHSKITAEQMAEYICQFSLTGKSLFNGKIIPVSITTP